MRLFLSPKIGQALVGAILTLALAGPALAQPPGPGPRVNPGKAARYEAIQAQERMHERMRQKARGGKPAAMAAAAASPPADSPAGASTWGLPRLSLKSLLKSGILMLLWASDPAALAVGQPVLPAAPAAAQPLSPGAISQFGILQKFNLSAPDPTNVFVAQAVTQALINANATGTLPPLSQLNSMLAGASPSGSSVLATLPEFENLPKPNFPGESILGGLATDEPISVGLNNATLTDDMIALQATLNTAQLTEAYYIQASIGQNLLAEGSLFPQISPALADALNFAGNELLSTGQATAAAASQIEVAAAEYAIAALQKVEAAQPAAKPAPTGGRSQGAPPQAGAGSDLLDGSLDPELIYGFWQWFDNTRSGKVIRYKFTRSGMVKFTSTPAAEGGHSIQNEALPGSVNGYVSYQVPDGASSPDQAVGKVLVTVVIEQLSGNSLTLNFAYIRVTFGDGVPAQDVLVQEDGEDMAFFRVGRF